MSGNMRWGKERGKRRAKEKEKEREKESKRKIILHCQEKLENIAE